MPQTLAARLKRESGAEPLVVGIMGSGHVRGGYGVTVPAIAAGVNA